MSNDNNPQVVGSDHGVNVASDAAAVTDNGTGLAAPGFKCKILPIRAGDANIQYGYDGIVYAADHGAKIINCSWGGSYGGSYGQDIVTYAVINKDALVVAAAGNDGADAKLYPASFTYAINVASTGQDDTRSSFSNYNYSVDVSAPGDWIWSASDGGGYTPASGTSMASPVAAGCAAVIRSFFPSFSALQAGEQLKVTSDNIDGLHSVTYKEKLGKGRVNLYKALTVTNLPSVDLTQLTITDNNDNTPVINDTMRITGLFTNYLSPSGSLTATLSAVGASGTYVTIQDNSASIGVINTLAAASHSSDPFRVLIKPNAPQNGTVNFKIALTDGSYSANFYFSVLVNVDYLNVNVNEIGTSFTSKGLVGYNAESQGQGLGFTYNGSSSLLFDASIMIGIASGPKVSDRARGDDGLTADNDFTSVQNVRSLIPPVISDFDGYGIFNDNAAGTNKLNILVRHYAYAWSKPGHTKYVIFKYSIKNNGSSALSSLYAGIFADWDIMTYANNKADYNVNKKLGYCYSTEDSGLYAGIQLLSPGDPVVYSIDNDGGNGSMNIYDGYTTAEKYQSLSTPRAQGGGSGTGADVSQVVGSGPFNLAAGDSVVVAFALMAGDSLEDILKTADSAYMQYNPCAQRALTVSSTPSTCGNSSGSAVASISSGLNPFTYAWSTGQSSSTATGLSGGMYTITITDGSGCQKSVPVAITNSDGPSIVSAVNNISCPGQDDGSALLTVTGGTPPYTYQWSNGLTSSSGTGLAAGNYQVTVTDNSGCISGVVIAIDEPESLLVSTAITPLVSGNDGAINLTVSGGSQPYSFLWSNSATAEDLTGLSSGSYTVTVTDAGGCTYVASATLDPVGISEAVNFRINTVFIYPLPANEIAFIEFTSSTVGVYELTFFDVTGKKAFSSVPIILNYGFNRLPVEVTGIAEGIYFIRIKTGIEIWYGKIVVAER